MARSTMTRLISAVRNITMAGDQETSVQGVNVNYWDDNAIQDILDNHRADVDRHYLRAVPSYSAGGVVQYKQYRSDTLGNFESTDGGSVGFIVQDSTGAVSGTANWSADYLRGVVTFVNNQAGTAYYITGAVYDVYGAAAELLYSWAAKESRSFDFDSDGQSFKRSQKATMLREAASECEAKAWVKSGSLVRTDA